MRERSEIPRVILATLGVLIINAAIFGIGVFLALSSYNSSFFVIPALSSAGISITQLIYVIPAAILLRLRQQFALEKGVVIGAVITAILNGVAICYYRFPGKFDLIKCYLHQLSEFLGCSGLPSNSTKARSHLFKFLEY